ncbi:hypothetical protein [Streptomyces sp. SudanB182_2057]|uniref:hypothetical protein n=1 Tax=Streptomyces sp. SudanB182_2057 TaxID=3035281 RepID=UPI003F5590F6
MDLAGPANETLPAVLDAARQLPKELASALTATARAAFTQSLHVHALILIPLLLTLSGLTLTLHHCQGQARKNQTSPDDHAADPALAAD